MATNLQIVNGVQTVFNSAECVNEAYKVATYMDRLKALSKAKGEMFEQFAKFTKKMEKIKELRTEEAATKEKELLFRLQKKFCGICKQCWAAKVLEDDLTKLLETGTDTEVLLLNATNIIDDQSQAILSQARVDCRVDIAASSLIIYQNLYFLFYGLDVLMKEDQKRITKWAVSLDRIRRRADKELPLNDPQCIADLVQEMEELLENIGFCVSDRTSQRNMSLANGAASLFKLVLNFCRYRWMRDPESIGDVVLYGGTTILAGASSGLSLWSAYQYHLLLKELEKCWQEVQTLQKSKKLIAIGNKDEEQQDNNIGQ